MCYGFYWRFLNEKNVRTVQRRTKHKRQRNAAIEANNTEQGVSLCCRNKNKTSKKEIFSFEELTKKQIEERLQND